MSTLDEVREREKHWPGLDPDRRFLLSQLDALQAECERLKIERDLLGDEMLLDRNAHFQRAERACDERDHLKAAVKAAGPALEAAKDYVSTYGGFPLDGYAVMRRRDAAFAALKLALDALTSADARRG